MTRSAPGPRHVGMRPPVGRVANRAGGCGTPGGERGGGEIPPRLPSFA